MNLKQKKHSVDLLFSFLLLLIFCLFSLLLAGMGSAVYRNGTEHLNENYTSRTAIAYLSEKVRQHDRTGDMTSVEDCQAIGFHDTIESGSFVTYVYFYDGALCELFIRDNVSPLADMGNRIVELSSFSFDNISNGIDSDNISHGSESAEGSAQALDDTHLLTATAISHEGNSLSVLIPLRSK